MTYDPATASQRFCNLGELPLESGQTILDCRLSYVVHGEASQSGDNVIVVTSSIAGTAHRLDFLIGAGKAFDPARYCIIGIDAIGNGRSISPSNSPRQPGMDFPRFTIRDMVNAQQRLVGEHLGLSRILAVAGASMGGMQALEWGVSCPEVMAALVALVPLACTPPWTVAMNETSRKVLMADAHWNGGRYTSQPELGWRAWSNLMSAFARSPAALHARFAQGVDVVDWLREEEEATLAGGFDANDWLYQTWAYDAHDVGGGRGFRGDTAAALASIRARTLVMGPALDLYNPAEQQREIGALVPRACYVEIPSIQGHAAAAGAEASDVACIDAAVARFLDR